MKIVIWSINMNKISNNKYLEEEDEEDELGIDIPLIDSIEKEKIGLILEDTFLIRLDSISQFGENSIDLDEVEKFLVKFPKHKDKINKILMKAKENKAKSDLSKKIKPT